MKDQAKTKKELIAHLAELREQLAALTRELAELKRGQPPCRERPLFEDLISDLSAKFVNLPAHEVDGNIEHALKRLGELLGDDRISLRQYVQPKSPLRVTHWWAVQGAPPPPDTLPNDAVPYVIGRLRNGKPFVFSRLDELPIEAHIDRKWFEALGQKSALAVPLRVGGLVIGGLTFASFGSEHDWSHPLIRRLEIFAQMVAGALPRKRIEGAIEARAQAPGLQEDTHGPHVHVPHGGPSLCHAKEIVGQSAAIKKVLTMAEQVARTDATVLIMGETGTGKDLLARFIHTMSPRGNRPMVTVNCSALPTTLIESELFGRERGAFTGAYAREMGRFELAHGTTLFLDEIGELTPEVQARLLRALEVGRFERLGSSRTIQVDARTIVATNKDLAHAVKTGAFRKDLYYRLNVFPIVLPPLRDRREDIPELVASFVGEFERKLAKGTQRINPNTMKALRNYDWPGNVRELKNVIERAMIMSLGITLDVAVPQDLKGEESGVMALEEVEKTHILNVMEITGGRVKGISGAARILRMNPSTLFSRMRKLGIKAPH